MTVMHDSNSDEQVHEYNDGDYFDETVGNVSYMMNRKIPLYPHMKYRHCEVVCDNLNNVNNWNVVFEGIGCH